MALGVPEDSLQSFPEAFRMGMAARADKLCNYGPNDPKAGVPLPMPRPDVLGRNGTFVGLRKYQSRVGTFNRFLHEHARTEQERELLAAKLVGRWRSGAPLTLALTHDDPALGADPRRNRMSACRRTGDIHDPATASQARVHGIQTFNVLRGGEYLFMPSLSALRWIGDLRHSSGPR